MQSRKKGQAAGKGTGVDTTAITLVLLFNGALWGFAGFSTLRRGIEVGERGPMVIGAAVLAVSGSCLAYAAFWRVLFPHKTRRTLILMAAMVGLAAAGGLGGLLAGTTPRLARYGDAFWERARGVCGGSGIPEAAAYAPAGGPHRIVAIGPDGEPSPTASLPDAWQPASPEDVGLVLCVGPERERTLESCTYGGGVSLTRTQHYQHFELRAARTGEIVDSADFEGDLPERCPRSTSRPPGSYELSGPHVSVSRQVVPWLRDYLGG